MADLRLIRASDGTGNASMATVQATRSPLATTITVDTVNNFPAHFIASMGTPHTFTDPVTGEVITVISEATCVDFVGHVDSGSIEIDSIAPGYTDLGSAVGDIVVLRPTTLWSDNLADTMAVVHEDDGTLKDDVVDTNAVQDNAITTAKIGTAQVKSSNIDFATLGAKIGVISGATLNSTGTKDITGLGFRPRVVRFTILWPPSTNLGSGGFGAAVSNVEQYAYAWGVNVSGGGSTRTNRTDSCIVAIGATSSTPQLRVSYTQSLADGFRLNVITAESIDVVYEAFQ